LAGLSHFKQSLEIGFQTGAIRTRILKQQLDQASLAGTKVSMNTAAGQAM